MLQKITIATANTEFEHMLQDPKGLDPVAHADVLMLQEVISSRPDLEARLRKDGFNLVHAVGAFGLAIAVRSDSILSPVANSNRSDTLQDMSFARVRKISGRGIIAVGFQGEEGMSLIAATTHPTPPFRFGARNKQVAAMSDVLEHPYYSGPLVLGGDMNHYPDPRAVDMDMRARAGFTAVDIGDQSTWRLSEGSHGRLVRVAGRVSGRDPASFDGQLDTLLYRSTANNLQEISSEVVPIPSSDHEGVVSIFALSPHDPIAND